MSGALSKSWGALGCAFALAWPGTALGGSLAASTTGVSTAPQPARSRPERRSLPERPGADRGIVQSVSASRLVLKTLDGRTIAVKVDARTRVFLNGKRAS